MRGTKPAEPRPGGGKAGGGRGGAPPAAVPPPPTKPAPQAAPQAEPPKFDWIEQVEQQEGTIKAARAASLRAANPAQARTAARQGSVAPTGASASPDALQSRSGSRLGAALQPAPPPLAPQSSTAAVEVVPRGRAPTPSDPLFSDDKAGSIIDGNIKNPNVKAQLLTRALEESRLKMQTLQQQRAEVADALLRLCQAAGVDENAADAWDLAAGSLDPETATHQRLELLRGQVAALQDALPARGEALAEAQEGHESAAVRLVAQAQELEAAEAALGEYRHRVHMQAQEQEALQLKLGMLEAQLASESSSARRRMEEQLDSFRGDVETARTLRGRCADMGHQLELAQRMRRDEAERAAQLAAQLERMRGELGEANTRAESSSQRLLERTATCKELEAGRHEAREQARALAEANHGLRATLAEHAERALLADSLQHSLAATQEEAAATQAAMQAEIEQQREELRAEWERNAALQAQLTDERLAGQSGRALLQAKEEEIASLLVQLDEYSSRVVASTDQLRSEQQAAAEARLRWQHADALAERQRQEIATLQASLGELAGSEVGARHAQQEAERRSAATAAKLAAAEQRSVALRGELESARGRAEALQQKVAQQAEELERLAAVEQRSLRVLAEAASLADRLRAESDACAQLQQNAVELTLARDKLAEELHKLSVVSGHYRQRAEELEKQLAVTSSELKATTSKVQLLRAEVAQARQAHGDEVAALEGVHAARKHRNEQLEHDNRQQAAVIASLEKGNASLAARLAAEQGRADVLRRFATAHGQAYGRLTGHAAELQEQFCRQLAALLHLCRHNLLELDSALAEADPVAALSSERCVHPPAVTAALAALDGLRMELRVAVAMLEAQTRGPESSALAEVPQDIDSRLQQDLAGLPSSAALSAPKPSARQTAVSVRPGEGAAAAPSSCPAVLGGSPVPVPPAAASGIDATPPNNGPTPAMTAQVSQMERQLEVLMHRNTELSSRAAAAEALHQQEQEARQRAQDLATTLTADLTCSQAQLAEVQEERWALEARCKGLGKELRDAIYTISQMHAEQQGPQLTWQLRGLRSRGAQTQYCELWERTLGDPGETEEEAGGGAVSETGPRGLGVEAAAGGASSGGEGRVAPPLAAVKRLIAEVMRAKAVADIAAARSQQPFAALDEFLEAFITQQHGLETAAAVQRRELLQAGVEAWARTDVEVALFGLSAELLAEGPGGRLVSTRGRTSRDAAADRVPLVLYAGAWQRPEMARAEALTSLRGFCHARWHAAYLASRARPALMACSFADGLHSICGEVQALVASVPGAELLLRWVATRGVGRCVADLDLGLPLAENQAPQLYLLAVDACRILGVSAAPRLYVLPSAEPAIYYLQLPADTAFHSLAGGLARTTRAPGPPQLPAALPSGSEPRAATAAEASEGEAPAGGSSTGMNWEPALVLTSRLVDLLEPEELQAAMAGCLGLHAALESEAASQPAAVPSALARWLAALQTAASLAALAPKLLLRQLPHQAAPLFFSRLQPVLLRARRYLAFQTDRTALAVAGGDVRLVAGMLLKLAAGSAVLRNKLGLDAVLAQARALGDAAAAALPRLLRQEDGAVRMSAGASLALLRVHELAKWQARGCKARQAAAAELAAREARGEASAADATDPA
eukprot:scaffold1.g5256.t1